MKRPRVAILFDFEEEKWPSMQLVGEMLVNHLESGYSDAWSVASMCPPMRFRLARAPLLANLGFKLDRVVNRFWDYPRWVRPQRRDFDVFHVVDHSYAQLVHELPASRTIVSCHDLDVFRCLFEAERLRYSMPLKAMAKRILAGLRKAARVTCDSAATRDELVARGLMAANRVVVIPNGVHPSCSPDHDPAAESEATRLLGTRGGNVIEILHVGSTVKRKRIDVLLKVFALVRQEFPQARLVRVGGSFTAEQLKLVERLGIGESVVVLPFLDRRVLAAVYRRAALVLQPSEREGFGLPVIEAMACGTPVVASDLPVLRETGGHSATNYCPVGDVGSWSASVVKLLYERRDDPDRWSVRRLAAITYASKFSWAAYTKQVVALYHQLLDS
jgi:glycosyltransferase involved in cell wall biosynthesis